MMKRLTLILTLLLLLSTLYKEAFAMLMPYPYTVERLSKDAALVVKAKVLSIEPVKSVKSMPTYSTFWKLKKARLEIISSIKGKPGGKQIDFVYRSDQRRERNNDAIPDMTADNDAHYNLELNKSYILFLTKQANSTTYHQLITNPTTRSWEGFIPAFDDKPVVSSLNCPQIIFNELKKQLVSANDNVAQNAAFALLAMSSTTDFGCDCTNDYSRKLVMQDIFANKGMPHKALTSAKNLPGFLYSFNIGPYLREDQTARYIWTKQPIFSNWSSSPKVDSSNLIPAIPFLIELANSNREMKIRRDAIFCLGTGRTNNNIKVKVQPQLKKWLESKETGIKSAACLVAADYPELIPAPKRMELLKDNYSEIRDAATLFVAVTQIADEQTVGQLEKGLQDQDSKVKGHSALALVSLPIDKTKKILLNNLRNSDFGTAFLARIAALDPALVHKELVTECNTKTDPSSEVPKNEAQIFFQNALGTNPHYLVRRAVSNYLKALPPEELKKKSNAELVDCLKDQPEFKI
ncbi:MAG: hypothetical protein KIT34_10025 [Cyanobacteria bacterium TGS_CYA1]|nr:hypothetical protein [Cyanobacteria bacterium TGS_CYA1]